MPYYPLTGVLQQRGPEWVLEVEGDLNGKPFKLVQRQPFEDGKTPDFGSDSYTELLMECAACLWEAAMDMKPHHPGLREWLECNGYCDVRMTVIGWAAECDRDYQKAVADGFEDSFDWEFVPDWLSRKLEQVL